MVLENLVGQRAISGDGVPSSAARVFRRDASGLGYSQLNELLLLLGFDRVTRPFFQFLIDGKINYREGGSFKSLSELNSAVERFRTVALLRFGNVKFGYKVFSRDVDELQAEVIRLRPIHTSRFTSRNDAIIPIRPIPPSETYFLGYMIERELERRLKADPTDVEAINDETRRKRTVEVGKENQAAYLASDHMDVYVATSMRQRHEFLAVNRLAGEIFGHAQLVRLKLRWFDPTQAYCKDRIDKGLSEALMLRRAKCTIYLAQESDTLGKDSELASTLAQGKPVIAFVPAVDEGFVSRLLDALHLAYPRRELRDLLLEQLQVFEPRAAWTDPELRRWIETPSSVPIRALQRRLQHVMKEHYDGRAKTLRETHPVGVQVNLATGVANGVLVVRTTADCARLVRRIVTRTLRFKVSEEDGGTVLLETISGCVFRIATNDQMLTNAFWNFYLAPSE
jgi:hypothetical protein